MKRFISTLRSLTHPAFSLNYLTSNFCNYFSADWQNIWEILYNSLYALYFERAMEMCCNISVYPPVMTALSCITALGGCLSTASYWWAQGKYLPNFCAVALPQWCCFRRTALCFSKAWYRNQNSLGVCVAPVLKGLLFRQANYRNFVFKGKGDKGKKKKKKQSKVMFPANSQRKEFSNALSVCRELRIAVFDGFLIFPRVPTYANIYSLCTQTASEHCWCICVCI